MSLHCLQFSPDHCRTQQNILSYQVIVVAVSWSSGPSFDSFDLNLPSLICRTSHCPTKIHADFTDIGYRCCRHIHLNCKSTFPPTRSVSEARPLFQLPPRFCSNLAPYVAPGWKSDGVRSPWTTNAAVSTAGVYTVSICILLSGICYCQIHDK